MLSRNSSLFILAYLAATGLLMYVDIMVLGWADAKFHEVLFYSFWTFYWPVWAGTGIPIVAAVILGCSLLPRRPAWSLHAVWLVVIVSLMQVAAASGLLLHSSSGPAVDNRPQVPRMRLKPTARPGRSRQPDVEISRRPWAPPGACQRPPLMP
jgi:hypothetical protein